MRITLTVISISLVVFIVGGCGGAAGTEGVVVKSPNGKVSAVISKSPSGQLQYQVQHAGRAVVEPSPLGVTVDNANLGRGVELGKPKRSSIKESYPSRGVHATAVNRCKIARIPVTHTATATQYELQVRCFDDGVGLRYIIDGKPSYTVSGEDTSFKLPADSKVWFQTNTANYEAEYSAAAIEKMPTDKHVGPPLVVELPRGGGYAAITEAALFNYSGMTLRPQGGDSRTFQAAFDDDKTWELKDKVKTPWRVVITAPNLDAMVNTDIIGNLNDPPSKQLAEADWIKPGRAFWHWWSGTMGNWDSVAYDKQFAWIDNAAEFGFEYYLVDAGWEFTWKKPGKDEWQHLKELCDYAAKKNVGIIVWKRWNVGSTEGVQETNAINTRSTRLEFFSRCRQAGVAGVKIDYMDSEAKNTIDFYTDVLKDSIAYKLMINFHGANKPTGESRTYPNEVTREGIKGLEYNKWSNLSPGHYASLPFTRYIAGHGDFTPCTFNAEMLKGTTFALQLAAAVCYTSPVMHYADKPELYLKSAAADVIKEIPSTWVETRVLPGSKIGDLAVMARRDCRGRWFAGIINGSGAREYTLDLSFLGKGSYKSIQLGDKPGKADAFERFRKTVTKSDSIEVKMNAGGGFVAMFEPAK
ncbi:MAG: glycoside hydrolase family 97 catalytic domain-containing protein [Sedimentisphaerales bacterium]|nr:glycoside hydrolase family 97 catalytic domain-containing protein [Sedimentisphaerales bacterium]